MIKVQKKPSIEGIQALQVESKVTWITPIISHIQEGKLQEDPNEARRTRVRLAKFTILNGQLYKGGYALPYLNFLNQQEANYALKQINKGICRNHLGKVIRVGYFWPTIQKDAHSV